MLHLFLFSSLAHAALPPITGSFLNVAYDARLAFSNSPAHAFSCSQWAAKAGEWGGSGLSLIIFQAVHDDRFGAYFPSATLPLWNGSCGNVVGSVLDGAQRAGARVLLSCEWAHNESDGVAPPLIAARLVIMRELASLFSAHPALAGWYFSSEAVLTPHFSPSFISYVAQLSAAARAATPAAPFILVSPYGTRGAVGDAAFVAQLAQLGSFVDAIAYQDEVGCVRDELPVATVAAAWRVLGAAHAAAGPGAPALWANVEAFTWQYPWPNNVSTPLVPAPWPRLLGQLAAASPHVERVITFSAEGLFDPPASPQPWGPPDAARLWTAWRQFFSSSGGAARPAAAALLGGCIEVGALHHGGEGAAIATLLPLPRGGGGAAALLTDGACGSFFDPWDGRYLAWDSGSLQGRSLDVVLALNTTLVVRSGAVQALVVSGAWLKDGSAGAPVARNVSSGAPRSAKFFGALQLLPPGAPGWVLLGAASEAPWMGEGLDVRVALLQWESGGGGGEARFVWVSVEPAEGEGLLLGEVAINWVGATGRAI